MERFQYFVKEALRNLWVNRMMSLASVSVLILCMVFLGTSLLISHNIRELLDQLNSANQIMLFLEGDVTQEQVDSIEAQIKAVPNVKSVTFLTREDMFNEAKRLMDQESILLAGLSGMDFHPAFQIAVEDMSQFTQTTAALKKIESGGYIQQDPTLAQTLANIRKAVYIVGFWLFVIMSVVALFIIINTIKVAMFNRRREINIMKFVGATDAFIRWPFIMEGICLGLISSVLALGIQVLLYDLMVLRVFNALVVFRAISIRSELWWVAGGFITAGVAVGVIGSVVSVRKYLRV